MRCNDSQNYMMKLFDKEINDIEEAQLKQHLKTCSTCSKEYFSLKEIFSFIEQDPEIEPPKDFELQVMSRIEKEATMYENNSELGTFVLNTLVVAISFIFVILFGGILWEVVKTPANSIQIIQSVIDFSKDFFSAAISVCRGMAIAIVSVTASIYKTYYYAYIVLGILLLLIQRVFIRMVREGNGGAQ